MKNFILFLCFFVVMGYSVQAQEKTPQQKIYHAYIENDVALWTDGIAILQTQADNAPADMDALYELTKAQYGFIGYSLGKKKYDEAEKVLAAASKNVNQLLSKKGDWSNVHALRAGLYGLEIALSHLQAVVLVPKSTEHINKSLAIDNNNPVAWVEQGNLNYHLPSLFGGGVDIAIDNYVKSIELFEQNNDLAENWLYVHTLARLGMAYEKSNQQDKALAVYKKALKAEPNFEWVKDQLYPNLQATLINK